MLCRTWIMSGIALALFLCISGCSRDRDKEFRDEQKWALDESKKLKEGMTVKEAEAIVGVGQKGTVDGDECLAWGKQARVWIKVADGKVANVDWDRRSPSKFVPSRK